MPRIRLSLPYRVRNGTILLGPPAAGEEDGEASEASEWGERERAERLAELRAEEERLGEEW